MNNDSGHESTTTSLDENQVDGKDVLKKTEQATKNSVLAIAEDEDSLIEEGSDFFWLLQNVVWNAVKSLFIIFVLLGIIWLVWSKSPAGGDGSSVGGREEVSKETPQKTQIENKKQEDLKVIQTTPKTNIPETVAVENEPVIVDNLRAVNTELGNVAEKAADWHTYIDKKRMFVSEKSLSESFLWLRDVETIYSITLPSHFTEENYTGRKDKINGFLNQVSYLLSESLRIRTQVYEKSRVYSAEAAQAESLFEQTTNQINTAVQLKQAVNLPSLIQQKAEQSKNFSMNKTESEVRETVLATMERYDRSLRSLYEVVFANQEAIAHDIQVVNFPSDPFNRVITPAQWRGP